MADKYLIRSAHVCIVCDTVREDKLLKKIVSEVCVKCGTHLKEEFKEWNKNGMYITPKK